MIQNFGLSILLRTRLASPRQVPGLWEESQSLEGGSQRLELLAASPTFDFEIEVT
ncbi:hypothetical protein DAPPUDRAFT_234139 [Daphnia pulex]|uniref:Uncharacterized protein n=1 Tax=Daphnia pulex TaxID=6669 RepID=E9FUP0_DAPPU|nr:hypothetical protein DAPPUDRAFT_234139 [Daphnia pulex]|eukprot:EFX88892.1 hypothetical protein DAPPUDRAFT_234139 [Daphnia pulex]